MIGGIKEETSSTYSQGKKSDLLNLKLDTGCWITSGPFLVRHQNHA